ncbi:MAG: extracellular solute-binding protein [Sphaerochaetaceae bacterium]|nr:extracellular solute-binding protein [Sphaerochaetaceae bacterium]
MKRLVLLTVCLFIVSAVFAQGSAETAGDGEIVLELARFFGDPDDSLMDSTDLSKANSEAAAVQILTNIFNEEYAGSIRVEKLGGSEWGSYYDQLNTTFASGNPPDVAVMHQTNMPAYASRGLLVSLEKLLSDQGVDMDDWTAPARVAVSYDGTVYGSPFDLHANLLHVNVDIFKEAGLVDAEGIPILPTSIEEFYAQAEIVKQKTGKLYWVEDATQFPISYRLFHTLMEQQGVSIVDTDTNTVHVNTDEGRKALTFMNDRFSRGYSDPNLDYTGAEQVFMSGGAAIELNGTWVVDMYNRELDFEYRAMNFPALMGDQKVWASSHMWVVPVQKEKDAHYEAAATFAAFMNRHVYEWAVGTGHIAPNISALEKLSTDEVPQRANYARTASIAATFPPVLNYAMIETIIKEEIETCWLLDVPVQQALEKAQRRIEDVLR